MIKIVNSEKWMEVRENLKPTDTGAHICVNNVAGIGSKCAKGNFSIIAILCQLIGFLNEDIAKSHKLFCDVLCKFLDRTADHMYQHFSGPSPNKPDPAQRKSFIERLQSRKIDPTTRWGQQTLAAIEALYALQVQLFVPQ